MWQLIKYSLAFFLIFSSFSNAAQVRSGGGGGSGGGSGTVNSGTVSRAAVYVTAGTAVSSSTKLFDNGTNVGIGTIAPRTSVEIGVQTMNINGTNVGIGSITPGQALDVQGTVRASSDMVIGSQSVCQKNGTNCPAASAAPGGGLNAVQYSNGSVISGKEQTFSFNATNVGIGTVNGRALLELTTGNFYVNGGNIGVGSIAPGQALDVQGTVRASADFIDTNVKSAVLKTDSNGKIIATSNLTDTAYSTAVGANPTATVGTSAVNGASANFMRADGAPAIDLTMAPTWTGLHTFNKSGTSLVTAANVGINSTAPGNLLDVQGTARMTGFTLSGNGAASGFILQTSGATGIGTWVPEPTGGSTNPGGSPPQLQYASNSTTFGGIGSGGTDGTNIGIGTVAFNNRLNIVGNVGISTLANSPYVTNTLASPNALVVEGNVGVGTWVPSALLEVGKQTVDIFSGGNVGIGTLNPGQVLDVNGAGRFNGAGVSTFGSNVGIGTTVGVPNALYVVGTPMFTTGLNIGIGTASATRLCIANNAVSTCP